MDQTAPLRLKEAGPLTPCSTVDLNPPKVSSLCSTVDLNQTAARQLDELAAERQFGGGSKPSSTALAEQLELYASAKYLAVGDANSRVKVLSFPEMHECYSRSLGCGGARVVCSAIGRGPLKNTLHLACGSDEGCVYLLVLGNENWDAKPTSSSMGISGRENTKIRIFGEGASGTRAGATAGEYTSLYDKYGGGVHLKATPAKKSFSSARDLKLLGQVKLLQGHGDAVCSVTFSEDGHFVLSGGMDGRQLAFDAKTGQRLPSLYVVREVPFQTRSFLLREEEDVGPTPEGTTTPAAAREGGAQRGAPVQQGSAAGRASASSRPRMATFTAPAFVPPTRLVPNLAHASRPGTSYSTLGSVDRSVSGRIGYGGSSASGRRPARPSQRPPKLDPRHPDSIFKNSLSKAAADADLAGGSSSATSSTSLPAGSRGTDSSSAAGGFLRPGSAASSAGPSSTAPHKNKNASRCFELGKSETAVVCSAPASGAGQTTAVSGISILASATGEALQRGLAGCNNCSAIIQVAPWKSGVGRRSQLVVALPGKQFQLVYEKVEGGGAMEMA